MSRTTNVQMASELLNKTRLAAIVCNRTFLLEIYHILIINMFYESLELP